MSGHGEDARTISDGDVPEMASSEGEKDGILQKDDAKTVLEECLLPH